MALLEEIKLHEECGVFGISVPHEKQLNPVLETVTALFALQHRGQGSCGIAVSRDSTVSVQTGQGLVADVFTDRAVSGLDGEMAMGHVRYAYSSDASGSSAQPIVIRHVNGSLCVAHNGRLANSVQLRNDAEMHGAIFQTAGDAELISYMIVRERLRTNTLEDAVLNAMQYMVGAYSLVLMSGKKLIAVRDPNGFRPLCMGTLDGCVVFSSESCALDAIGATFVRDIEPGEVVVAQNGAVHALSSGIRVKPSLCVFEYIYFARPDSVIDGLSVDLVRQEAGKCLARADDTPADVVIGVPDSGLSAAMGYARQSGIPYAVGLIKNRYVGRTFIQPKQNQRESAVKIKLNALSSTLRGKRVIMVDDSLVRGTTCARIVSLLREAGATQVHMRISSPPFLHPCYFGTDIPDRDALIAHGRTSQEIARLIGADSLKYLQLEDLGQIVDGTKNGVCDGCFTGRYAVPVPRDPMQLINGRSEE